MRFPPISIIVTGFTFVSTGPFTLWDGNHRAVALLGYYDLIREEFAKVGSHDARVAAAFEEIERHSVRLFVGQSRTVRHGHKGTFYCPTEGL